MSLTQSVVNVATKATVSFFFGSSVMGNSAFGGSVVAKKLGQLLSDWTLTVTRFVNTPKLSMVSVCGLRFWMLTENLPTTLVTPDAGLKVIFFGAFILTTARSCGMGLTCVTAVAMLFAALGSGLLAEAVTILVMLPTAFGVTT